MEKNYLSQLSRQLEKLQINEEIMWAQRAKKSNGLEKETANH